MTKAEKAKIKHATTSMRDSQKAQQVAWVLLGVLLFAVPLVCGWPSGPWIPSGFGAVSYTLAISVCLLCGPKRTRHTHAPWLALGILAALVSGLMLVEACTIRIISRWGLVGLSRMGLVGDRIPATPTLEILEFILSTAALVLWTALQPELGVGASPNGTPSKATRCELSGGRLSCSLALGTLLAFGLRTASSAASSGGWYWSLVCLLFSVGLFPILVALSKSTGNVFVTHRGKRYGLGEGSRLYMASVLFGMLLWSLFDVIGWLFLADASVRSMGTAAVLFFLAFGGITLAILATRDGSRSESATQASWSNNFSENNKRSDAFAPSLAAFRGNPRHRGIERKGASGGQRHTLRAFAIRDGEPNVRGIIHRWQLSVAGISQARSDIEAGAYRAA